MAFPTITGAGSSTATKFYGDAMNRLSNMLNGVDISLDATVLIHKNVLWVFKDNALRIENPAGTFKYILTPAALTVADRILNLPLITGTDTLVSNDVQALLTNKTLQDSTVLFVDNSDTTKKLAIQCVGITTGTTRTWTAPDADITIGPTVIGLQDLWVMAGAFTSATTNPVTFTSAESTTNKLNYHYMLYPDSAVGNAWIQWQPPRNYNNGTVKVKVYWTATSGTGDVKFFVAAVAVSNDDALDAALGTAQTVTDTLITANDLHQTAFTSSITIAGTPADEDIIFLRVRRDPTDVADTIGADVRILGIGIEYTIDAAVAA